MHNTFWEMKASRHYVKTVEWSDEDQCDVGSCTCLFFGGCHGDNGETVFLELCELVKEAVEI